MIRAFESLIDLLFGTAPTMKEVEAQIEAQRQEALITDLKLRYSAGEDINGVWLRNGTMEMTGIRGEKFLGKGQYSSGISHFEEGRPQYNNYCAEVEVWHWIGWKE